MLTKVANNRAAVIFSVQSWLGESEDAKKNASTPGYFSVGMSSTSPSSHTFSTSTWIPTSYRLC